MLKIATLEFYLNTDKVVNHVFSDTSSLLDSDVVISDPSQLHKYWQGAIKFNDGKYRLNSSKGSDDLLKLFAKREKEIQTLLSNGKVCISFLTPVSEVLAEQNGTRNYIWLNNYQWFGARKDLLKFLISGEGEQISLEQSNHPFAPFFNAFKNNLTYHAYLDDDVNDTTVTFLKNKAKKPVAFFMQLDQGYLIFLPKPKPPINAEKLIGVLIQCTEPLINKKSKTPEPEWTKNFEIPGEQIVVEKIQSKQIEIENLNEELARLNDDRQELVEYRALLYEKGQLLENIVLRSLRLMGFEANRLQENDLEHDVVLESPEGRAIAEIEGKDKDAIHIEKLDQLSRVVDEDFNSKGKYPEGILIGNHYRFTHPDQRKEAFTEKVYLAAQRKRFGLLTTVELFKAVKHILENPSDEEFKKLCRIAILSSRDKEIILGK